MGRRPAAKILYHLIFLYLGIFLAMGSWGMAGAVLGRRSREAAAVSPPPRGGPTLAEMMGFWPAGRRGWRRLLELGIPGLATAGRRLTRLPVPRPGRPSASPASSWGSSSTPG